jgi:hypothetical protein
MKAPGTEKPATRPLRGLAWIPLLAVLLPGAVRGDTGWWMKEPIRWIQTNLRETDATLDPARFIGQIADFQANVLLMQMGGISAFYPTRVAFHARNPFAPAGRDVFGDVLKAAHGKGIRIIGRFDFSKTDKAGFDAHPEWYFRRADGSPVIYNGLYQVCVNGGWYREKAPEILAEALSLYDMDGLFFNMFSNSSTDYSGNPLGLCHCDNCRSLFRSRFGRELPDRPDADYRTFLAECTRSMSEAIARLVKSRRPEVMLVGMSPDVTDGVFSESNTAVRRPLPLWPYASSDNVNRARNSWPDKMAINNCMSFVDFPWRFAAVPPTENRLRIWQNVAHGGAAALNMHGTMEQEDRTAVEAVRPIYAWLKEHAADYVGQTNPARVLLLGGGGDRFGASDASYRGLFRLLSEEHIPFGVVDNLDWLGRRPVDLVIACGDVPPALEAYAREGGRVLAAGPKRPPFGVGPEVKLWKDVQGYFRIRDHALFPSLGATNLAFFYGDYLEVEGRSPVTFIPPSMFGPPELVHADWRDTESPGLILDKIGRGEIAWIPWDIGSLYYFHSSRTHAGMLSDLIDHLLPGGRQLRTDAHPLVETVLMRRGERYVLHLINLSGHSQTAYFDPIPMGPIRLRLVLEAGAARAVRLGRDLAVKRSGKEIEIVVPSLSEYELIELR